jgi:hypothetical protein
MRVPAARVEAGAFGIIDREGAVRVPDAIAFENAIGLLHA